MATAFFNQLADRTKAAAIFARTDPGRRVHPEVLDVMLEVGIDLSNAQPQKLTEERANDAGLLITMGCGDKCPYIPGPHRHDWPLEDPKACRWSRCGSPGTMLEAEFKILLILRDVVSRRITCSRELALSVEEGTR